jgi:hypothetical protein
MALSSSITTLVNPPLPVDPTLVKRNIQVLKAINASWAFNTWIPVDARAENTYHEGDSPAVVDLKITRLAVQEWD